MKAHFVVDDIFCIGISRLFRAPVTILSKDFTVVDFSEQASKFYLDFGSPGETEKHVWSETRSVWKKYCPNLIKVAKYFLAILGSNYS